MPYVAASTRREGMLPPRQRLVWPGRGDLPAPRFPCGELPRLRRNGLPDEGQPRLAAPQRLLSTSIAEEGQFRRDCKALQQYTRQHESGFPSYTVRLLAEP